MDRITRGLAALTVTALAGAALVGCSSDESEVAPGVTAAPTTSGMTTTSSTSVPGPADAEVDIPATVADRWNELGGTEGGLGPASGPATDVAGGTVVDFDGGAIALAPDGRAFVVQGEILTAYRESGGPAGELGFPTSDEAATDGGWISTFDGGAITYIDGRTEVLTD